MMDGRSSQFLRIVILAAVAAVAAAQCPVTCTPPEVYRFRTGCEVPEYSMEGYTRIHTIQGRRLKSAYEGQTVTTIGSVTAMVPEGFFMQDPYEDCDDATSEGIFVYTGEWVNYVRYQVIEVTGVVEEVSYGGSLSITQVRASSRRIIFAGNAEPNPHSYYAEGRVSRFGSYEQDRSASRTDLSNSSCGDEASDTLCQYARYESMLMKIGNPIAAGTSRNGETAVIRDGPAGRDATDYSGGAVLKPWTVGRYVGEAVVIRNKIPGAENVGGPAPFRDDFPIGTTFRRIKGIFTLDTDGMMVVWPTYKLEEVVAAPARPTPACTAGSWSANLRVASYDLRRYCHGMDSESIADQLADGLDCPDVIALQGVGDDSCGMDEGTVSAELGLSELTTAINRPGRCGRSSRHYVALQIDPANRQDGGSLNSRVVVLYNIYKLIFNERTHPSPATTGTQYEGGRLTINPGRVNPTSQAFAGEHKTMALEFEHTSGRKVFVVVNHWISRSTDDGLFSAMQPPVQHSQETREAQQSEVSAFLRTLPASAAGVFVLGNLNDFHWSNPVGGLHTESGPRYANLWRKLPNRERYSYYDLGRFMPLDHIIVRRAEFGSCSLCALRGNTIGGAGQVSDHDPIVAECSGFSGDANPAA